MDNWGQGTFTLSVSRLYRRAIGISDVEGVSYSLFSPSLSFLAWEVQVFGFHIPIEVMQVYVGQQGAHDTSLWCACQGFLCTPLLHYACTQEFPDKVSDVPVRYSFFDRFY